MAARDRALRAVPGQRRTRERGPDRGRQDARPDAAREAAVTPPPDPSSFVGPKTPVPRNVQIRAVMSASRARAGNRPESPGQSTHFRRSPAHVRAGHTPCSRPVGGSPFRGPRACDRHRAATLRGPGAREGVDMRHRMTTARGLSLVEVTIMLFVLMLLTGVLAPSIMDFVRDAQWVKVKEDCEAIGVSVARLARDVGPCLKFDGTGACTKTNRVDVLYSDGPDVDAGRHVGRRDGQLLRRRRHRHGPQLAQGRLARRLDGAPVRRQRQRAQLPDARRPEQLRHPRARRSASAGAAPTCRRPSAPTRGDTATWSTPCSSRWRPTPGRRAPPPATTCRRSSCRRRAAGRTTPSASRPGPTASTRPPSAATPRTASTRRGDDFIYIISGDTR